MSFDDLKIFNLLLFDNNVLFHILNTETGSPLINGYMYTDSTTIGFVNSIQEHENRVFLSFVTDKAFLGVYNMTTFTFDYFYEYDISVWRILAIVVNYQNYIFYAGKNVASDEFWLSKMYYSIGASSPWGSNSSSTPSVITSDYKIWESSGADPSITSVVFTYSTPASVTLLPKTSTETSSTSQSVWNEDHYEAHLLTNTYYELNFTWTWSPTEASDTIVHTLVDVDSETIPEWVLLDNDLKLITLDKTPSLLTKAIYKFGLSSTWDDSEATKKFILIVSPCEVENCLRWDTFSNLWGECSSEYSPTSDKIKCVIPIEEDHSSSTETRVVQAVVAVGVAISIGASVLSMSSPQGAFSMLNQFQMFILLPMIGAYIPESIIKIITGMSFAMFSFSFIPVEKIPLIADIFNFIDYDQSDDYFDRIGLTSGSAFLNHISLFLILGVLILYHLSLLPWCKATKNLSESSWTKCVIKKLFDMMTFSVYIRLFLEAYLFMSISTTNELKEFDYSTVFKMFSLCMSFLFAIWLLSMLILSVVLIVKAIISKHQSKNWYFREFFNGIKETTKAKNYNLMFIMVRLLSVITVIVFSSMVLISKTVVFSLIQFSFSLYVILSRPFSQVKDTVIEGTNSAIFFILSSLLIYFDAKNKWSTVLEKIFVWLILAGPVIATFISLAMLIVDIVKKIKRWPHRKDNKVYDKQLKISKYLVIYFNSAPSAINISVRPSSIIEESKWNNNVSLITIRSFLKPS
jgi:hypothetical protein